MSLLVAFFLYSFWKSLFVGSDSSPAKLLLFSFMTQGSLLYGGALLLVAILLYSFFQTWRSSLVGGGSSLVALLFAYPTWRTLSDGG